MWGRKRPQRKKKALLVCLLLLFILLAVLLYAMEQMTPLIRTAAMRQSLLLISAEVTRAARDELINYEDEFAYTDLMHIERDDNGQVRLIAPDTMLLNRVISDTSLAVQQCILTMEEQQLSLPLGTITGNWLLSALGPDMQLNFMFQGVPCITVYDELDDAGINQVRHRIYLEIGCEVQVIVPFSTMLDTVTCTVMLAEGIIVGCTPDTYISWDGTGFDSYVNE